MTATKAPSNKTGNYAVTSIKTIAWLNQPTRGPEKKTQKKDIKHPIFAEIANNCTDEFWKDLLNNCARGKFPKCYDFKDGELIHRRSVKMALSPDPTEHYNQIKDFMRKNSGIKSPTDLEIERIDEERYLANVYTTDLVSWKEIRAIKMREILISRYVQKLVPDSYEQKLLYDRICNGFTLGKLTNSDVLFEKCEIKTIYGLVYDATLNNYVIDNSRRARRIKRSKSELITNHCYCKAWIKYNKQLKKSQSCQNFSQN